MTNHDIVLDLAQNWLIIFFIQRKLFVGQKLEKYVARRRVFSGVFGAYLVNNFWRYCSNNGDTQFFKDSIFLSKSMVRGSKQPKPHLKENIFKMFDMLSLIVFDCSRDSYGRCTVIKPRVLENLLRTRRRSSWSSGARSHPVYSTYWPKLRRWEDEWLPFILLTFLRFSADISRL